MPRESIRALKCYAEGQAYCLEIGDVLAIERGERMVANPDPSGPRGWIVRRGLRIPVFGLAELLGVGPRSSRTGVVLVLDRRHPWGMAVERVARLEAGSAALQPLPRPAGGPRTACFRGVISEGASLILSLAPEHLRADAAPPAALPAPAAAPAASRGAAPVRAAGRGQLLLFSPPNCERPTDGAEARLADRFLLGLSYSQTLEIVSGVRYTPVPGAPRHVLGLIPWRSRPLAVVDAGAMLGFAPATTRVDNRVVVVRSPRWRTLIAIPMGGGVQTRRLPLEHRACPSDLPLDLTGARGVFALGDERVLVVPDVDAMAAPPAN